MSWNYVAKAHSKKHGHVCIKVSVDENLISDEIKALEYFNGFGMIKLIDHDTSYAAAPSCQENLLKIFINLMKEPIAIYFRVIELYYQLQGQINTKKHQKTGLKLLIVYPKIAKRLIHKAKILSKEMLDQPHDESSTW